MKTTTQKPVKKSTLSTETEEFTELSTSALLARKSVPALHREIANNYVLIKRIYKFQAVKSRLTSSEQLLLKKYNFATLAETDIKTVNKELELIRNMSADADESVRRDADELIITRTKELKYIVASRYPNIHSEIENGYVALERYFEEISKYYS